MKKIKLMGLLSAPIVLSTMPIFSTSCSSSATITLTGTTQVDNRADLENFQKDIYDKFLKDKYTYFGSPVENHSSDSIYNQSLVNDFKSEINSPTILRQAALWTMQSNFQKVVTQLYDAEFPVVCKYSIDFRCDTSDYSFTGLSKFDFTSSNSVAFSMSTYIPSAVSLAATYDTGDKEPVPVGNECKVHNLVYRTKDGKNTVQHVESFTDIDGNTTTTKNTLSYIELFMGIFINPGSNYVGPDSTSEIWASNPGLTVTGNELKIIDLDTPTNNWVDWKDSASGGAEDWYFKIVMTPETQSAELKMDPDGRTITKAASANWPDTISVKAYNKKSGSFLVGPNTDDYIVLY